MDLEFCLGKILGDIVEEIGRNVVEVFVDLGVKFDMVL